MAKILLVNPPFYRFLGSHYNANSLGIAYIASYLNKRGHNAWLYTKRTVAHGLPLLRAVARYLGSHNSGGMAGCWFKTWQFVY